MKEKKHSNSTEHLYKIFIACSHHYCSGSMGIYGIYQTE